MNSGLKDSNESGTIHQKTMTLLSLVGKGQERTMNGHIAQ